MTENLLNIREASRWATEYIGKPVSAYNISYLIQYGRIEKIGGSGGVYVSKDELLNYYKDLKSSKEFAWKDRLGDDLNWTLSFDKYTESQTTKHVHRLHPYKGKFIPQLVEYFLDEKTDKFKQKVFFRKGDIVLDPFCGSGTTLVQANELGINAVGVDISAFNALISNVKIQAVDFTDLATQLNDITWSLKNFVAETRHIDFENKLAEFLSEYNGEFFPSPEFKVRARSKEFDVKDYTRKHEAVVLQKFNEAVSEFAIKIKQDAQAKFLDKWFVQSVRDEIDFVAALVETVENEQTKKILTVVLSRTARSCRATTHADLATLVEPVTTTYYCAKHGKICKPLFSIVAWWERYAKDTVGRLKFFEKLKTDTRQLCLNGNSETLDIFAALDKENADFAALARRQKIKGIFSSPPYVGLIDYHEQHA